MNNLSKVVMQLCNSENETHDLLITNPTPYRPKVSDVLQLGSKGRYGSCLVTGKTM